MRAGQRECSLIMIETRRAPRGLGMALRAILGKSGVRVIGVIDRIVVGLMAAYAFPRKSVLIVNMAIHAA